MADNCAPVESLSVKNFMTYASCRITPGPGFNLIVGPNGSGKSTLLIALYLGLGGKLSSLLRQRDVRDLVRDKSRCPASAAEVEIGLRSKTGQRLVVKYKIDKASTAEAAEQFSVDGIPSSRKAVVALARSMNIEPENMCQFLPQERVSAFAGMNSAGIFATTMKSMGNRKLLKDLEEHKAKLSEVTKLKERLQAKLAMLTSVNKELSAKEGKLRLLSELEGKMRLKKCLDVVVKASRVMQLEVNASKASKEQDQVKAKLRQARKSEVEAKKELEGYESRKPSLDAEIRAGRETIDGCIAEVRSRTVDASPLQRIDERALLVERTLQELEGNKSKRRAIEKQMKRWKSELEAIDSDNLGDTIAGLSDSIGELQNERMRLNVGLQECKRSINLSEATIQQLDKLIANEEERSLLALKSCNPDAYNGVRWLKENRKRFSEPDKVYEPVMMVIDVQDDSFARHLERVIGRNDLEAFICENVSDANTLMTCLRSNRQKINVVSHAFDPRQQQQLPPEGGRGGGNGSGEGFFYLSELVGPRCPDAVRQFLCKKKRLDSIPVFTDPRSRRIAQFARNGKPHFVNDDFISYSGSRYSNIRTEKLETLSQAPPRCLSNGAARNPDEDDFRHVKLRQYRQQLESSRTRQLAIEQELCRVKSKLEEETKRLDVGRTAQARFWDLRNKISFNAEILESGEEALRREHDRATKELGEAIRQLPSACEALLATVRKQAEAAIEVKLAESKLQRLENVFQRWRTAEREAGVQIKLMEEEEAELEADAKKAASLKASLLEGAQKAIQAKQCPRTARGVLANLPPLEQATLLEENIQCDADVGKWEARVWALQEDIRAIDLSDFDKRCLAKLQENKCQFERSCSETEAKLRERTLECESSKREIVETTTDLVSRLSERFGHHMRELGYAGEVSLVEEQQQQQQHQEGGEAQRGLPYGMEIRVKFRHAEQLTLFQHAVQSGGEKSVTTALYILALQSLSPMPLCCVDELNQGMDAQNEGSVWKLLLRSQAEVSSQFFYFSPTLSKSLDLSCSCDNILVHICNTDHKIAATSG